MTSSPNCSKNEVTEQLVNFLTSIFYTGIEYGDAISVCMAVFCSKDNLPDDLKSKSLTMDIVAESFAEIAKSGFITDYSEIKSVFYGANYHSIEDKGHWIEVLASIFKLGRSYDAECANKVLICRCAETTRNPE